MQTTTARWAGGLNDGEHASTPRESVKPVNAQPANGGAGPHRRPFRQSTKSVDNCVDCCRRRPKPAAGKASPRRVKIERQISLFLIQTTYRIFPKSSPLGKAFLPVRRTSMWIPVESAPMKPLLPQKSSPAQSFPVSGSTAPRARRSEALPLMWIAARSRPHPCRRPATSISH